jgi:hypothetical protein
MEEDWLFWETALNSTRQQNDTGMLSRGMQCCHVVMNARGAQANPDVMFNNDDDSMIYSTRSTQE